MSFGNNVKMIWDFLKVRKKWWLIPIIIFTLIVSLILISTSQTAIAPFIYPLF